MSAQHCISSSRPKHDYQQLFHWLEWSARLGTPASAVQPKQAHLNPGLTLSWQSANRLPGLAHRLCVTSAGAQLRLQACGNPAARSQAAARQLGLLSLPSKLCAPLLKQHRGQRQAQAEAAHAAPRYHPGSLSLSLRCALRGGVRPQHAARPPTAVGRFAGAHLSSLNARGRAAGAEHGQ
jgi:hypothetical protein